MRKRLCNYRRTSTRSPHICVRGPPSGGREVIAVNEDKDVARIPAEALADSPDSQRSFAGRCGILGRRSCPRSSNAPRLEHDVPAISARHKKPWIRTKNDLSFLPDLGHFASFGRLRRFLRLRTFCSRRRPRDDSSSFSKVRKWLLV